MALFTFLCFKIAEALRSLCLASVADQFISLIQAGNLLRITVNMLTDPYLYWILLAPLLGVHACESQHDDSDSKNCK